MRINFMDIIAKYIHGSEDSTDVDIHYVVDKLPELNECKKFCSENPDENRNLITIENGIVTDCYKGTIDEINNALIETYSLHKQDYPLLVTRKVQRTKPLKLIRAIRVILSHLSRSSYRPEIKLALRSNLTTRLKTLDSVDLTKVDFNNLNKNMSPEDIAKTIAFQIYQTWMLIVNDVEIYTKNGKKDEFSEKLVPILHREPFTDELKVVLNNALHKFLSEIFRMQESLSVYKDIDDNTVQWTVVPECKIELIHEKIVEVTIPELPITITENVHGNELIGIDKQFGAPYSSLI